MAASFEGHVDIVKMLIEAKAQVNTQEEVRECGFTINHHAENALHNTSSDIVLQYNLAVLGELTVHFCSQGGFAALHMAVHEGKLDVVRVLTEAYTPFTRAR